jgi:hypothetical protein
MTDAVQCSVEYLHELAAHQSYDMDAASKMFENRIQAPATCGSRLQ